MRREHKILLGVAVTAFIGFDIFLLSRLLGFRLDAPFLSKSEDRQVNSIKEISIETIDAVSGLIITVNVPEALRMLKGTNVVSDSNTVMNLDTLVEYSPEKIIFEFVEAAAPPPDRPLTRMNSNGMFAHASSYSMNPEELRIVFSLNPQYFSSILESDIQFSVEYLMAEVFLKIGKLHEVKRHLIDDEYDFLSKELGPTLKSYEVIHVKKI